MVAREIIVWTCDVCGSEDLVDTHVLTVDGHTVEAEACEKCWGKVVKALVPMSKAGRVPVLTKVSARKEIVPFPGQAWRYTAHALKRMGERHINPVDAARAADDPEVVSPGLKEGSEIRMRGNVKVVVKPAGSLIITASKRDEAVDHVA